MSLKPPDAATLPTASRVDVLFEAPVNVQYPEYGAVGDGTTDDTAAIQAALNHAAGGSALIPITAAHYKTTAKLVVPANTAVDGMSGGTFWGSTGKSTIKKTNGDTGGSAIFEPGTDCVLRNLRLEGPDPVYFLAAIYPAGTANPSYGILPAANAFGMIVEGCTFSFFKAAGIGGTAGTLYEVPRLSGCHFVSNLMGVDWAANDPRVVDCVFRHNVNTGYRGRNAYNLLLGNRIEWNGRYGIQIDGGQATIIGNVIDRNGWSGVKLASGAWGWTITGNYFARNGGGGNGTVGRTAAITTSALDPAGNLMYLAPATELDKSHVQAEFAKYGVCVGNRFVAGQDDAGGGARSPKYVFALKDIDNIVLGPNEDTIGWQHNVADLGSVEYGDGTGARIYTTGSVTYTDPLNLTGVAGSWTAKNFLISAVDGSGVFTMPEQSTTAAPPANNARIYAEDNGAGKTRLMARFPTGAAIVLATEP